MDAFMYLVRCSQIAPNLINFLENFSSNDEEECAKCQCPVFGFCSQCTSVNKVRSGSAGRSLHTKNDQNADLLVVKVVDFLLTPTKILFLTHESKVFAITNNDL